MGKLICTNEGRRGRGINPNRQRERRSRYRLTWKLEITHDRNQGDFLSTKLLPYILERDKLNDRITNNKDTLSRRRLGESQMKRLYFNFCDFCKSAKNSANPQV